MYKLKFTDGHGHAAGTVVYDSVKHDYGLASDDTRLTGVEHVSVTLNEDGDYPTFTVALDNLEKI